MSGKTISKGTLGLRFMQMAARSKQMELEVEKAPVKDDGYWEVEKEVRDAWGIGESASSQTTTHEASYLPFLYALDASQRPDRPRGRRTFNKHGEEEFEKEKSEPVPTPSEDAKPESKGPKVHPRPKAISSASGHLFGFPQEQPRSARTAKEAIYDNAGVGADLRRSKTEPSKPIVPPGFIKPAGVDDPLKERPSSSKPVPERTNEEADIIPGARKKKTKRERPDIDGEPAKRKRKKKSTS